MAAEIGQFSLVLALLVAVAQATIPLYGASTNNHVLMTFAQPAAKTQCLFVAMAFITIPATAQPTVSQYFQGFETNIAGWDAFGGAFNATRVPSGERMECFVSYPSFVTRSRSVSPSDASRSRSSS